MLKEIRKWKQRRRVKRLIRELTETLFEKHWPSYYDVGLSKQQLNDDIATHICVLLNKAVECGYEWNVEHVNRS